MAEVQHGNTNATSDAADAKKRKGFLSNVFGRSSNATNTDKNKDGQEPKRRGFMNSLTSNARQAATKEVMHVAEHEAMKQVEAQFHNSNGSQPTDTTTATPSVGPDTSTVTAATTATPSDVLSAPTNWAKRMVDSAQQKVQGLQNLGS